MRSLLAVSLLFSFLLIAALAPAQPCLTGADTPPNGDCNGTVEIGELLDYIDVWYGCSECVPDLFQSIEAYYNGPVCVSCRLPAIPSGYITWFRFDTETGGITPDETGDHDGTLIDNARIVSDAERGQVLGLDGAGDYVDVADEAAFDFVTGDFAVSAWVKPNAGCCSSYAGIVSKWSDNSAAGWSFEMEGASERIRLVVRTSDWDLAVADSALPANQWTHVVGQLNGSTLEVYVNGVLQQTTGTLSGSRTTNDRTINIGREQDDYAAFNGLMDDVIIYGRSLSAQEITGIYNSGVECAQDIDCDDGNPCTIDACDPSDAGADARGCVTENVEAGTACDDNLVCTENDQCDGSGVCSGTPRVCPGDGVACTDDLCSEPTGCESVANDSNCNYPEETCNVSLGCVANPCFGILRCSDYSQADCPNDPCNVPGDCEWNASTLQCEDKVIPSDCNKFVIATGGATAGNCDSTNACTLDYARQTAVARDIICLREGNYGIVSFGDSDNTGTDWDNKITYKNAPDETAVFSRLSFADIGGYLEFDGFLIDVTDLGSGIVLLNDVTHMRFLNLKIDGMQEWEYWTDPGISYYGVDFNVNGAGFSDILVQGSEITKFRRGVQIAGSGRGKDIVIRNNEMHFLSMSGIHIATHPSEESLLIEGNHIHNQVTSYDGSQHSHGSGFEIRSSHAIMRNNIIHDYGNSAPIRTYGTPTDGPYHDLIFENNLIYDSINYAEGPVWIMNCGDNIVFRNNTIVGEHYGNGGSMWYGIPLRFSSPGASCSFELHNNVFVGALVFQDGASPDAFVGNIMWSHQDNGAWKSEVAGNIIVNPGDASEPDYFESDGNFFVGPLNYSLRHELDLNGSFHPVITSDACNGSINPPGVAVGALPCV